MYKMLLPLALITSAHATAPDHIFEFGVKTTSYDYTERDQQDQILNTEESTFFEVGGIYASYDYKLKEINYPDGNVAHYLNFYGSYTGGDTDYKGSTLKPNDGCDTYGCLTSTTFNEFYEIEVNLKRVTYYDTSSRYILFGLGYKEWKRELSSAQIETYHYRYAQIGVGGEKQIYKDWSLGIDLTAQIAFNPEMDADFDENDKTNALNETLKLGAVYTYKVAIPLTIPINKELSFTTKAEYEFTNFNVSDPITVDNYYKPGKEPMNCGPGEDQSCGPSAIFTEPASIQKNWHFYAGLQLVF